MIPERRFTAWLARIFARKIHTHDTAHDHDADYADIAHAHPPHDHDADYADIGHVHASSAMWFVADRTCISPHSLSAGAWTELAFPCNENGFPFSGGAYAGWNGTSHQIREPQYGLWLYEIAIGALSAPGGNQYVGLRNHLPGTPVITNWVQAGLGFTQFSQQIITYIDTDVDLRPIVFVNTAASFSPSIVSTWFRASRLAPAI